MSAWTRLLYSTYMQVQNRLVPDSPQWQVVTHIMQVDIFKGLETILIGKHWPWLFDLAPNDNLIFHTDVLDYLMHYGSKDNIGATPPGWLMA